MEGDSYRISQIAQIVISIHSLRMEGDWSVVPLSPTVGYFNPLPPYGGRLATARNTAQHGYFNPLPPYGGRHISNATTQQDKLFQSTPSVWRETFLPRFSAFVAVISIHSRLVGHGAPSVLLIFTCNLNPPPPLGGRRPVRPSAISCTRFQSTPSVWRETYGRIDKAGCTEYFNPLPPYGGRQITHELTDIPPAFQSTPSVWRETQGKRFCA